MIPDRKYLSSSDPLGNLLHLAPDASCLYKSILIRRYLHLLGNSFAICCVLHPLLSVCTVRVFLESTSMFWPIPFQPREIHLRISAYTDCFFHTPQSQWPRISCQPCFSHTPESQYYTFWKHISNLSHHARRVTLTNMHLNTLGYRERCLASTRLNPNKLANHSKTLSTLENLPTFNHPPERILHKPTSHRH